MSLDTLANVKSRLGVTSSSDDTLLSLLQDSADQAIENHCNRDFAGGSFTEYHPGGSEFVHLRNYPIATVTSVKVDPSYTFGSETVVSSSAYVVHTEYGVIQSLVGPFLPAKGTGLVNEDLRIWTRGPRIVQVVYSTATSQVPHDVKEAYARLIGHWYRRAKTESGANFQNLSQQKFGDTFVSYSAIDDVGLPQVVKDLLVAYRMPGI